MSWATTKIVTSVVSCRSDEQADDLLLVAHVEVRERLVEQQEVRTVDERLRDGDPLLLSARELGQPSVRVLASAHTLECLVDAAALIRTCAAQPPSATGDARASRGRGTGSRRRRSPCSSAARTRRGGCPLSGTSPSTVTSPLAGVRRPSSSCSSVVFPEPFGPITITTEPAWDGKRAV